MAVAVWLLLSVGAIMSLHTQLCGELDEVTLIKTKKVSVKKLN